jgi:hypothetical protein
MVESQKIKFKRNYVTSLMLENYTVPKPKSKRQKETIA